MMNGKRNEQNDEEEGSVEDVEVIFNEDEKLSNQQEQQEEKERFSDSQDK